MLARWIDAVDHMYIENLEVGENKCPSFCQRSLGDVPLLVILSPQTSAVSMIDGWLELNFASCVIRVLHYMCNTNGVFVSCIYDMVVDTQFHTFAGRPFARVL